MMGLSVATPAFGLSPLRHRPKRLFVRRLSARRPSCLTTPARRRHRSAPSAQRRPGPALGLRLAGSPPPWRGPIGGPAADRRPRSVPSRSFIRFRHVPQSGPRRGHPRPRSVGRSAAPQRRQIGGPVRSFSAVFRSHMPPRVSLTRVRVREAASWRSPPSWCGASTRRNRACREFTARRWSHWRPPIFTAAPSPARPGPAGSIWPLGSDWSWPGLPPRSVGAAFGGAENQLGNRGRSSEKMFRHVSKWVY